MKQDNEDMIVHNGDDYIGYVKEETLGKTLRFLWKGDDKYYKAILLSTQLWIWLYQNIDKWKDASPYWNEIRGMGGYCPLCDYYQKGCSWCILFKRGACRDAYTCRLGNLRHVAFYYAFRGVSPYKRKCARAFIASKLRRELRRLTMEGVKK